MEHLYAHVELTQKPAVQDVVPHLAVESIAVSDGRLVHPEKGELHAPEKGRQWNLKAIIIDFFNFIVQLIDNQLMYSPIYLPSFLKNTFITV